MKSSKQHKPPQRTAKHGSQDANHAAQVPHKRILPSAFIRKFCITKVFIGEFNKMNSNHMLIALDYLHNLETNRRQHLDQVLRKVKRVLNHGSTSHLHMQTTFITMDTLTKMEHKTARYYAKIAVDIRVCAMILIIHSEHTDVPDIVAHLNTLFPAVDEPLPNGHFAPGSLAQWNMIFFKEMQVSKGKGCLPCQSQFDGYLKTENGAKWKEVCKDVTKYIDQANAGILTCLWYLREDIADPNIARKPQMLHDKGTKSSFSNLVAEQAHNQSLKQSLPKTPQSENPSTPQTPGSGRLRDRLRNKFSRSALRLDNGALRLPSGGFNLLNVNRYAGAPKPGASQQRPTVLSKLRKMTSKVSLIAVTPTYTATKPLANIITNSSANTSAKVSARSGKKISADTSKSISMEIEDVVRPELRARPAILDQHFQPPPNLHPKDTKYMRQSIWDDVDEEYDAIREALVTPTAVNRYEDLGYDPFVPPLMKTTPFVKVAFATEVNVEPALVKEGKRRKKEEKQKMREKRVIEGGKMMEEQRKREEERHVEKRRKEEENRRKLEKAQKAPKRVKFQD